MSDFSDVEFFDNLEEQSTGTPVAPEGEYNAKIIDTNKYKSAAGNWTLKVTFQIAGGKYRDHNEWYNLWATNEDNKRISTEIFTRLAKAVGYMKYPENHSAFEGKGLRLSLSNVDDTFTNAEGKEISTKKTKIKLYLQSEDSDMTPPRENIPTM